MLTDEQLLRAYTHGRSEAAFAALVGRHVDLVYSTALRTVGEPQLAQDVAQSVFLHLARKAGLIRNPTPYLGGFTASHATKRATPSVPSAGGVAGNNKP